jgi:tRNA(fMet)-specific endonuclease VapC
MYMLDTNMCIYVLKHRDPKLRRKFKAIRNLCLSAIAYAELCYGIENGAAALKQERYKQLDLFLQRLIIEPWAEEAARHYGAIRAALKSSGQMIGNNDLLITAHARALDAVLVTNNTREFSRVPDLTVENWIE